VRDDWAPHVIVWAMAVPALAAVVWLLLDFANGG
jgi:hypothetical protein